ncbi:MAG: cation diffusion facilitator family transporter [Deltaproteobacteria bacterium]|jgi:cation diffusion facilitator family transporter|nr:cation diffusion facilitator family transporter [Deltaproteobacteria bacterium]
MSEDSATAGSKRDPFAGSGREPGPGAGKAPAGGSKYALFSIASNATLIILKLIAGALTGSIAIISEAVHSFLDLLASFMTWVAVRFSEHPPDLDHPFGHGKAENLASLFEALLIIAGGLYIVKEAIEGLMGDRHLPSLTAGILVMFLSSAVNLVVSAILFRKGKENGSPALVADAWHLRTDVYTSAGIMLALLVIHVGKLIDPALDLGFIDSAAALVVSFFILKTGWTLAWEAITNLLDHSLGDDELRMIEDHIARFAPKILGYRRLRTRRSGPFQIIVVDLFVDGGLSVWEAHELGNTVVLGIKKHYPHADITFHLEPVTAGDTCEIDPEARAKAKAAEAAADPKA